MFPITSIVTIGKLYEPSGLYIYPEGEYSSAHFPAKVIL